MVEECVDSGLRAFDIAAMASKQDVHNLEKTRPIICRKHALTMQDMEPSNIPKAGAIEGMQCHATPFSPALRMAAASSSRKSAVD